MKTTLRYVSVFAFCIALSGSVVRNVSGENKKYVSYLVTWSATAEGTHIQRGGSTETFVADTSGSAIQRFEEVAGKLRPYDARWLEVSVHERNEDVGAARTVRTRTGVTVSRPYESTFVIDDDSTYAGYSVPNGQRGYDGVLATAPHKDRNGKWVIDGWRFLQGVGLMRFARIYSNSRGGSRTLPWASYLLGRPGVSGLPVGPSDNPSSLSLNADGAVGWRNIHWTAAAHRLGSCDEQDWPIPDSDPIIQSHNITVKAENTEVAPDGSTKVKITVKCDHAPIEGAEILLRVEPKENSGGHFAHNAWRPRGKLKNTELTEAKPEITVTTDKNGEVVVPYALPIVGTDSAKYGAYKIGIAGDYEIKAKSKRFANTASDVVTADYKGLAPMSASGESLVLVTGGGPAHQQHFYGTTGTDTAFAQLALDFYTAQQIHNAVLQKCDAGWKSYPLSINDIALPTGGVFDINADWKPPHQTHNKGEGGDFNRMGEACCFGADCQGNFVNPQVLLTHVLLELGQKYGRWDCSDLHEAWNYDCEAGEIPEAPWFPNRLHLHVQD